MSIKKSIFIVLLTSIFSLCLAKEYTNTSYYISYDENNHSKYVLVMPSTDKIYTHDAGDISNLTRIDEQFISFPIYENGELCFSSLDSSSSGENGASIMASRCYEVDFFYTQIESDADSIPFLLYDKDALKVYEGLAGDASSFKVIEDFDYDYNGFSVDLKNSSVSFKTINKIDFKSTSTLNNEASYITSQCYTKTVDDNGVVHNPCFTCHINSKAPNYINDPDLQETSSFSEYSKVNRFTNLFKDRTDEVSKISDEGILSYVREDNYKDENGTIKISQKLKDIPTIWDINDNGLWDGYTPDCYFNFDSEGFDKDSDGNFTGWRAFGYYPFLGTFWPTNGSTDDVLMRLSDEFMQDENGVFNLDVYKINLAIVESLIKEKDIWFSKSIDENIYGVDLDNDGELGLASKVTFSWVKPSYDASTGLIKDFSMSYVGMAKEKLNSNEHLIAPGLYPKGTEFLHSVRYIDIEDDNSTIKIASRMKELRYGKKTSWNTYGQLLNATLAEIKEKDVFPDRLRTIVGDSENGLQTGLGWVYQGFIEDVDGELRPQNYEETKYCIGCHSGIGAIKDSTFVFQRKFENTHFQNGWYHWSQSEDGFKNISEPLTQDGIYEYTLYLKQNHAGDEFRDNEEIIEKFFNDDGELIQAEADKIKNDISYLIYPSIQRALMLNKAYKVIVDEQSFIYGRDAHLKPVTNVHKEIEIDSSTQIDAIKYDLN